MHEGRGRIGVSTEDGRYETANNRDIKAERRKDVHEEKREKQRVIHSLLHTPETKREDCTKKTTEQQRQQLPAAEWSEPS